MSFGSHSRSFSTSEKNNQTTKQQASSHEQDSFCMQIFCGLNPGKVLIYLSVRGRAAEQDIIFRILTPGQGNIFVKIGSMTGSIFVIFDSERL